jgi:chromosome segregation protein
MRIRKIELQGFKSFVDRQTFHFGDGIAGVVGPNGCGKSNISDAIRWCIGEMSAKSLRGSEMQDVIFNGTRDRKPVGMAEVGMTFLAGSEPFPGQWARYEELEVTRRLFRTGQSEYLINQEKVRRRDIQDLFLDTGISNPLYSFVEQGRVEFLISSKPEKRRELIEEAAGISRYKVRRAESLSKLEKTEQNLARTTNLTDEMAKRLRSLERQVQKAAMYRRLRAWVRQGEIFLSLAKFNGLIGDRKALFIHLRDAKQKAESESREVLRKEKELGQEREELLVIEAVVGGIRDELSEMEALRREQESARHYQGREQKDLNTRLEAIVQALSRLSEQEAQAEVEARELGINLSAARGLLGKGEDRIAHCEGEAGTRMVRLDAHRAHERGLDTELVRWVTEQAAKEAQLQAKDAHNASIAERLAHMGEEGAEAEEAMRGLQLALKDANAALERTEELVGKASAEVAQYAAARVQADAEREDREQDFREARQHASELALTVARAESRLKSLEELQEAHAGVAEGAKRFLDHPKSLGSLAEHLDVPPEEERRAQELLGPLLSLVLVANDQDLHAMLETVEDGARVGLLSLEHAKKRQGLAARLKGSTHGQAALGILLENWTESEDLLTGLRQGRAGRGSLVKGGHMVAPGGVIWVGNPGAEASTALLRRRRQIAELQEEVQVLQGEHANAQLQADDAQSKRDAAQAAQITIGIQLEQARVCLKDAEIAVAQARHEMAEKERDELRRKTAQDSLGQKIQILHQSQLACRGELGQLKAALEEHQAMARGARSALEKHRQQGDQIEGAAAEARDLLARSQSERKGVSDRMELLQSTLDSVHVRQKDIVERTGRLQVENETAAKRIDVLQADDLRLCESIAELESKQGLLREKLGIEGRRLQIARERMAEMDEHLRTLRNKREKARAACTRVEMELQEVRLRIESVRDQVQQRYELSLAAMLDQIDRDGHLLLEAGEQALADLPIDDSKLPEVQDFPVRLCMLENESLITEWVERVQESRRKVEMLGEVNLAALQEFVELRARHTYLEEQRSDLEESVASIRKAIAQLNRTCRERFRDAYDRVNANFQVLYPRLVGGGSASLQLTNEDDLLETGVDILAQPPGKRLQNLSLLSGGEKAMTALALIFSLFQVKPSPFCLLDEVDAPLDDSNGARFNQMLREMSETSQFIVITHNKKTMEVMDTLYGVTMPKPGQSRLVTVQIH